jgi:putative CocE/NonD family hydrolase
VSLAAGARVDGLNTVVRLPPSGAGPWPASLFRTPYGVDFEMVDVNLGRNPATVAVVTQDVRGRGGSSGVFDFGLSDGADGAAAVAWAAAQPWCDGTVGMHGISYAGMTQLRAARSRPAGLRAIAPARCPAWWRPLTMHEGGALCLSLAAHWMPRQAAEAPDTHDAARGALYALALEFEQVVRVGADGLPCLDVAAARAHHALSRLPLIDRAEYAAAPLFGRAWQELFTAPFTHTWLSDPGPPAQDAFDVPVLIVGGWYDLWAQDQVSMFAALQRGGAAGGAQHRLVMAPTSHAPAPAGLTALAPNAGRYDDALLVEWTQSWLAGDGGIARDLAPVTYYVVGADRWDEAASWPPPGVRSLPLYLQAGPDRSSGSLGVAGPDDDGAVWWVHDPSDPVPTRGGPALGLPAGPMDQDGISGGARPDVCSFTGPPLGEPLELAGPVVATIWLATDAADTDVCVRLLDVDAAGRAVNITDGYVRGRHRFGPGTPRLRRGAVERFPVHCWNIAYRVEAGHRLRVDVCSSSFPRYDVNAGTGATPGTDRREDLRAARQTLCTGPATPSLVVVTVRPGA